MVKVSGVWVSPIGIESVLSEHNAVLEAAVVFRADAGEPLKPEHLWFRAKHAFRAQRGYESCKASCSIA